MVSKEKDREELKTVGKTLFLLFLATTGLASCKGFVPSSAMNPTVETQAVIPTTAFIASLMPSPSPLPPTETTTPIPQSSSIPLSGIPTFIAMESGVTWTECVVPDKNYAHSQPDMDFAARCLNMERPRWNDNDRNMTGERIEGKNGSDSRLVIGNDIFLVKHDSTNGCCDYKFLKNGKIIMETSAPLITFDPNRNLWNIRGKAVWELITDPPTIIVDGIDFNNKYQLEGAFVPYAINRKLIYIARKNGKFHIVYDEKVIGPEFDEIYISYCCATTRVLYGGGRYWFWGKHEGSFYVVGIQ